MELAQSIVHMLVALLSWQWLILIPAVSFHSTLRRLFERVIGLSLRSDRGFSARDGAYLLWATTSRGCASLRMDRYGRSILKLILRRCSRHQRANKP